MPATYSPPLTHERTHRYPHSRCRWTGHRHDLTSWTRSGRVGGAHKGARALAAQHGGRRGLGRPPVLLPHVRRCALRDGTAGPCMGCVYLRFTTSMMKPRARAQMTLPPTPRTLLNVWGPIQNVWGTIHFVWSSPYMHGARSTVLRAFSHFHAIYRCFPYSCTLCKPDSQLKIDPTPTPLPPVMDVVNLRYTRHMLKIHGTTPED